MSVYLSTLTHSECSNTNRDLIFRQNYCIAWLILELAHLSVQKKHSIYSLKFLPSVGLLVFKFVTSKS